MNEQIPVAAAILKRDGITQERHPDVKTRIQASKGWVPLKFEELWEFRELFYFFMWRDLKIRYKQTVMGVSWAIIQPLFTMVIFSLFFGRLAGVPSDGIPYPVFTLAALVPWTFFANSVGLASNSLLLNSNMIKKIYFPRLALPTATVLVGLLDFLIAFALLLVIMFYYSITPTIHLLWLPCFVLLALLTCLGVSLWLAALTVQFRDVRYVVPFLLQSWFFITPVAYPSSMLSQPWRTLYGLNPMAGVVDGFRWTLLGAGVAPGPLVWVSTLMAVALFVGGLFYFRRVEKTFADVI